MQLQYKHLTRLKKFEIQKVKRNKYVVHAIPTSWIERETDMKTKIEKE